MENQISASLRKLGKTESWPVLHTVLRMEGEGKVAVVVIALTILSADGPERLPEDWWAESLEAPGPPPLVCHAGGCFLHRCWCNVFLAGEPGASFSLALL